MPPSPAVFRACPGCVPAASRSSAAIHSDPAGRWLRPGCVPAVFRLYPGCFRMCSGCVPDVSGCIPAVSWTFPDVFWLCPGRFRMCSGCVLDVFGCVPNVSGCVLVPGRDRPGPGVGWVGNLLLFVLLFSSFIDVYLRSPARYSPTGSEQQALSTYVITYSDYNNTHINYRYI